MSLPPFDPDAEPDPGGADCVSCGRCCHHGPCTVHLLDTDEARFQARPDGDALLRRFTIVDDRPPGWRFVKNGGTRCAALDVSVPGRFPCLLYEVRPDDCRIVEPGSPACLEARRLGHLGSSVEYLRLSGRRARAAGERGQLSGDVGSDERRVTADGMVGDEDDR